MKLTIKCKLVAKLEDFYTTYVFENLNEEETSDYRYLMCTKLPNWEFYDYLTIGDVGFLQYEYVEQGTKYYNYRTETQETYKFSNFYFMNFIREQEKIINQEYKL